MALNSDGLRQQQQQQRDKFRGCCEKAEKGNKYGADELKTYIKKQKDLRKQRELQEYEQREQVLESKKQRLRELDLKCKKIAASKNLEKKTSVPTPTTQNRGGNLHRFPSNTNTKCVDNNNKISTSSSSRPKVKRTKYTCQEGEPLEIKSSKSNCKLEREAANFIFKEFENIVRRECRNILKSRSSPTSITSVREGASNGIKSHEKEKEADDTKKRRVDKAVGTSFTFYENDVVASQPQLSSRRQTYENSSDSQNSDNVKPVTSSRALHSLFTEKFRKHHHHHQNNNNKHPPPYVSRPTSEFVPESVKHAAASTIQAAYKSYKIRSILSEAKLRAYRSFHSSNYNNDSSSSQIGGDSSQIDVVSNGCSEEQKRKKMNFFKPPSTRNFTSGAQPAPEKPYDQSLFPNSSKPLSFSILNGLGSTTSTTTTTTKPIKPNPEDIPGYIPPPPGSLSQQRTTSNLSPRTLPMLRLNNKTADEPFPKQALDSLDTTRQNFSATTVSPLKLINSISQFQLPYSLQGTSSKDLLPSASSVKVINENILNAQNVRGGEQMKLYKSLSPPSYHNNHHHQSRRKSSSKNEASTCRYPPPPSSISTTTTPLTNGEVKKYHQKGTYVDLPDPAFSTVLQEKIRLLKKENCRTSVPSTSAKTSKMTATITAETKETRKAKSPTRKSSQMTAVSKATEQIKKKIVEAKQILEDYKLELLRSSSMSSLTQQKGDDATYESDFEVDVLSHSQSFSQIHTQNGSLYGHDSEILSSAGFPVQVNERSLKDSSRHSSLPHKSHDIKDDDDLTDNVRDEDGSKIDELLPADDNYDVGLKDDEDQSIMTEEPSILVEKSPPVILKEEEELSVQIEESSFLTEPSISVEVSSFLPEESAIAEEKSFLEKPPSIEEPPSLAEIDTTTTEGNQKTMSSPLPTGKSSQMTVVSKATEQIKKNIVEAKQILEDYKMELVKSSSISSLTKRQDDDATYESDFEVDVLSQSVSQIQNGSVHDSEILSSVGLQVDEPSVKDNSHQSPLPHISHDIVDDDLTDNVRDEDGSKIDELLPTDDNYDIGLKDDEDQSIMTEEPSILVEKSPPVIPKEEEELSVQIEESSFLVEEPSISVESSFLPEESSAEEKYFLEKQHPTEEPSSIPVNETKGNVPDSTLLSLNTLETEKDGDTKEEEKIELVIQEEDEKEQGDPKLKNLIEDNEKLDSVSGKIVSRMVKEVIHDRTEAMTEFPEPPIPTSIFVKKNEEEVFEEEDDSTHGEIDGEEEWFEDELVTTDPADEEKLKREAAEIVAEQLRIENEIRALEALQAQVPATLLNLSDIPDKPPPPYSPPSSDSLSFSMKSFAISCTSKQLRDMITKQVEKNWTVWKETGKFPKYEMELPEDKMTEEIVTGTGEKSRDPHDGDNGLHHHQETSGDTPLNPQSCDTNVKEIPTSVLSTRAFNTLLYDLILDTLKETLQVEDLDSPLAKQFVDRIRPGSLALAAQKMRVPTSKENLIDTVLEKVKNVLPYPILANVVPVPRRRLTKWTSRPRDLVDEVLAEELIEEDREWTESWPEEILVLDKWAEKYSRRILKEFLIDFKKFFD